MNLTLLIDLADVRDCTISNITGSREMMKLSFLGVSKILGLVPKLVILLATFSNQAARHLEFSHHNQVSYDRAFPGSILLRIPLLVNGLLFGMILYWNLSSSTFHCIPSALSADSSSILRPMLFNPLVSSESGISSRTSLLLLIH